jgi:phosphate transport system protein
MTDFSRDHIVAAYDAEFKKLSKLLAKMGGLVERQLVNALGSIEHRDHDLASSVKKSDREVDLLEREVESLVVRMLALRQPVANDLRYILSTLRTASDIERIGDYAKNIAKRAIALNQMPGEPPLHGILHMGQPVQAMLKDILDAHLQGDTAKAIRVWEADEDVDALYTSLFRELLTYMMEDPKHITPCTHLLFIAKNLERIGDHTTNIAETIHFQVEGVALDERRPKADASNYTTVSPTQTEDPLEEETR